MQGEEMSYINANDILPMGLMNEIQRYVQGVNLYIPKIPEKKCGYVTFRELDDGMYMKKRIKG